MTLNPPADPTDLRYGDEFELVGVADGELDVQALDDGVLVTLRGDWDLTNSAELRRELLTVVHTQPRVLALDLSGVTLLDSTALNGLVAAWRRARLLAVPIRLVAPSSCASKVLNITGIDRLFPTFSDRQTALTAV